ncbi:Fungal specific transcription factor domain containing protein [Elaphomyces granulatus]
MCLQDVAPSRHLPQPPFLQRSLPMQKFQFRDSAQYLSLAMADVSPKHVYLADSGKQNAAGTFRSANNVGASEYIHVEGGEKPSNDARSSSSRTPFEDGIEPGEASTPSSVRSLDAIDRLEEDLNRGEEARATGFIGKNSEIRWMQRVHREVEQRARRQSGTSDEMTNREQEDFPITSVNYHLDDLDISVPGPVDVYWVPPRRQASRLFEDYLTTVHPFFPIINRPLFTSQYMNYFNNNARPGPKWLAILNMIFAIAAKHAHLMQAPWRGEDEQDHLVYFTRARVLSMNGDVLFSHPDLQQVQVEGLIAFYLLASDQINRAWRISSLAVRSAIALGINMKSVSEATPNLSKEARYRVWWSLYNFEHLLGVMTGRAPCIVEATGTSPLPIPYEEERFQEPGITEILDNPQLREERLRMASGFTRQAAPNSTGFVELERTVKQPLSAWLQSVPPNSALFFLYYIDLAIIMQEIINKIYTADAIRLPWSHIENRIGDFKYLIDLWFNQLPEPFNFTNKHSDSPEFVRARLGLAFHYYSARITLGRPCLCHRDARSSHPQSFSQKMALFSLDAAVRMLDLIPDDPRPLQLYELSPWWNILHYLMQATTILLLELSFGNIHIPHDEINTLALSKKAILWLFAMSENSTASRRAWKLCDSCLRRIAAEMKFDVSDLPCLSTEPPPRPHVPLSNWSSGMEISALPQQQQNEFTWQDPSLGVTSFPPPAPGNPTVPTTIADSHFPYDPISSEFIRSFFPRPGEGDGDM